MAKANGHKASCKCPICKNMRKGKRKKRGGTANHKPGCGCVVCSKSSSGGRTRRGGLFNWGW